MTVERASEIVSALRTAPDTGTKEYELFGHFLDYFGFTSPEKREWFASLRSYGIARFVSFADERDEE